MIASVEENWDGRPWAIAFVPGVGEVGASFVGTDSVSQWTI